MSKKEAIIIDDDETQVQDSGTNSALLAGTVVYAARGTVQFFFALCGITDDESKYVHVLSKIEPKQAREIKDVIMWPPTTDKYKTLKRILIQRLMDSQEQRIRQLLEREELGDRKPSQFHLSTLARSTVPTELIRTVWLPAQIQAILATRIEDRLEDIADQADRIFKIGTKAIVIITSSCAAQIPQPSTAQTS